MSKPSRSMSPWSTTATEGQRTDRRHWPEYLIEAAGLGLFMVSACVFGSTCGMLSLSVVAPVEAALGFARGFLLGDPDGHALQVVQP